ncbi:MAG: type II toxin-antitoxin system PemK/MazF family toxin, partial [Muribaculaceae bacterium]|nr:type II toxin-antitoxin system PemK/MazF family toxin [Muribaculaceae bacterium]
MQAIRAGDLYFLQSPFSSGIVKDAIGTSQMEKRLSYLLGTVSSRPAVVVRPPMWWDRYNTVTVIPALTKGKPAIVLKLDDRYGFETEAEYPFVPHNPHTIPVARLGRYIGSLSGNELATLLHAFKWIHDPLMQEDQTIEVPEIYRDVWARQHLPKSWKDNRDARADVQISLTPTLVLQSKTNPELNGFELGAALGVFTDPVPVSDVEFV